MPLLAVVIGGVYRLGGQASKAAGPVPGGRDQQPLAVHDETLIAGLER